MARPWPGVARGRLDDRAARLEQAGALGGLDHRQADAVLDRAARVEHLELGQEERLAIGRPEVAGEPADPDERRAADQVQDRLRVLHRARGYRAALRPTRSEPAAVSHRGRAGRVAAAARSAAVAAGADASGGSTVHGWSASTAGPEDRGERIAHPVRASASSSREPSAGSGAPRARPARARAEVAGRTREAIRRPR